jgi:Icc-related predicted phosphoesterase
MFIHSRFSLRASSVVLIATIFAALPSCNRKQGPAELRVQVKAPFRFVAYGDTRFHDPNDTQAANPAVRANLVEAIAETNPAFVCFTGDIVYNGNDASDWQTWDRETAIWRNRKIPVYPALGNHDLHGDQKIALGNYFQRFPELNNSRFYSVRAANTLTLVLDSALDETSGPQGEWLAAKLDRIPSDVDFVFLMFHHPPYTSSSDEKKFGGGHSARTTEQHLAQILEDRQSRTRARFVVFSGHVHNYERHEHGGVLYFVSGGGGAHAYPIERGAKDPFQSKEINYHYLLVEVDHQLLRVTMNRVQLNNGKWIWSQPDLVKMNAAGVVSDASRAAAVSQP